MKKLLLALGCFIMVSFSVCASAQLAFGNRMTDTEVADGVVAVNTFLRTWLVEQDIEQASKSIAIDTQYEQSIINRYRLAGVQDLPLWSKKMLVLLLADNKDVLNIAKQRGGKAFDGYTALPEHAKGQQGLIRPTQIADAVQMKTSMVFVDSVVLCFRFTHTNRGDMTFVFTRVGNEWKVTNWLISTPVGES